MDENVKKILMDAVVSGTLKMVQDTFNEYNLQDESYFDYELLKSALRRRQKDIILFLLGLGCRVKNPNRRRNEETPFHLALLIEGKIEGYRFLEVNSDLTLADVRKIIEHMLENGASFYDKNSNGDTPLYAAYKACRQNYRTIGEALQFYPCNFNQENTDDVLHFHIACDIFHNFEGFPICEIDISKPISLNSEQFDLLGFSPIHYAINYDHSHFFERFMKCRDFSVKTSDGSTYLHEIYKAIRPLPIWRGKFWINKALKLAKDKNFVNAENKNGVSHFHVCCSSDEIEIVQRFIDDGVNVNKSISMESTFSAGYTALHIAVKSGNESVIELLLKNGADPNKVCKSGKTALHFACKNSKNLMIRKLLLDYKASPTIVNAKGLTPLHTLVYCTQMNGLLMFDTEMSKASWGPTNYVDEAGLSFFHIACMANDVNRVKEFLDSGANIDSQVPSGRYKGYTALHFAVIYKQRYVVEFLLKRNAKVNVELDGSKLTPLHLACEYLHYTYLDEGKFMHEDRSNELDIINLLILYGAHVDAKDSLGMTPLLHTCLAIEKCKHNPYDPFSDERAKLKEQRDKIKEEIGIRLTETIKILISNKANINVRTSNGSTILHIISRCKNLKITEKLMKILVISGIDVNAVNKAACTPLYVAAQCANPDMVELLLKYNANPNIQSKISKTPLNIVIRMHALRLDFSLFANQTFKYEFIIAQLLKYGADININASHTCDMLRIEDSKMGDEPYSVLLYMIFRHVQQLLALKLHVSKMLQDTCIKFHEIYKAKVPDSFYVEQLECDFYNSCLEELDKMKKTKLDAYTSLYDFLLRDPHELTNHIKSSVLTKILKDDKDFPLYSFLLRLQFKKGLLRRKIIQSAEAALQNVPNINLPDVCYNLIFKYLSNEDIVNLRKATRIECNVKRKLGDDSNQIELKPELKKNRQ